MLEWNIIAVEQTISGSSATTDVVERHGLGGRGIDMISRTTGSGTVDGFPLYDAHGNGVGTLTRSGTNSFAARDERTYDAWGAVRQGSGTGAPGGRYCAALGTSRTTRDEISLDSSTRRWSRVYRGRRNHGDSCCRTGVQSNAWRRTRSFRTHFLPREHHHEAAHAFLNRWIKGLSSAHRV